MSQQVLTREKQSMSPVVPDSAPASPHHESPPFSEAERKALRDEDYGAARLVVAIMGAVFTGGLALYIFIACLVAMGGH